MELQANITGQFQPGSNRIGRKPNKSQYPGSWLHYPCRCHISSGARRNPSRLSQLLKHSPQHFLLPSASFQVTRRVPAAYIPQADSPLIHIVPSDTQYRPKASRWSHMSRPIFTVTPPIEIDHFLERPKVDQIRNIPALLQSYIPSWLPERQIHPDPLRQS